VLNAEPTAGAGAVEASNPVGDTPLSTKEFDLDQVLSWIKAGCRRACKSFAMPPTPPTDPAREAVDLMSLAAWYRSWAELAGSDHERSRRLEFALGLERRAKKLLPPD